MKYACAWYELQEVETEFRSWCSKWQKEQDLGQPISQTVTDALKSCDIRFYPNIYTLLRLICTLPITTAV